MRRFEFRDETGFCGCLFLVVVGWLILAAALGGYKLFLWIWNL